jgi:hypothetical protein
MEIQNAKKYVMIQNLVTLVFVGVLFSGCVSYLPLGAVFNPKFECNQYKNFDFEKYQTDMQHPNRTTGTIFKVIENNNTEIISFFKDYKEKLVSQNRIDLNVKVNGDGYFDLSILNDSIEKDTAFNNKLRTLSKRMRIDSISEYYALAKIKIGILNLTEIKLVDSVQFFPQRTIKDITCVVSKNMNHFKDVYNQYLRDGEKFVGQIVVKFSINQQGDVFYAETVKTTINNKSFENEIITLVKSWKFPVLQNPGEITECIFPFNFKW